MKARLWIAVGALGLAVAAGCSSVDVKTRFDPAAPFRTYHLYYLYTYGSGDDPKGPGVLTDEGPVHDTITRILGEKGFEEASGEQAQFLVKLHRYRVHKGLEESEEQQEVEPEPVPPPVHQETPGNPDQGVKDQELVTEETPGGFGVEAVHFDALTVGDVLVQVYDAKTGALVWWGLGKGQVNPENPQAELEKTLRKTLAGFPPDVSSKR